jgi:colicin import membrane protein
MAAKKNPEKPSKSDFIRQQPKDVSVKEVVAAGKQAGQNLSEALVYSLRKPVGGKGSVKSVTLKKNASTKTGKKTSSKSASKQAKKTSKKTPVPTMTKADFVRQNPGVSARDLVAKAAFEGIEISENHVYGVRSQDKKSASTKARASTKSTAKTVSTKPTTISKKSPKPTASKGTGASGSSVEELLKAAAAELGLGRALEILQGERARVRAVMGG